MCMIRPVSVTVGPAYEEHHTRNSLAGYNSVLSASLVASDQLTPSASPNAKLQPMVAVISRTANDQLLAPNQLVPSSRIGPG